MSYSILNQSPVNGKIAWSSVRIVYDGAEYLVADGNTADKFVYWVASLPSALQTSAVFPTLAAQDCLVFLNNGGIATSILDASIVDGSLIVPGTVHAGALVANSITADQMAANSITGDEIAANSILAQHVVTNGITADKIDSRGLTIRDLAGNVIFGVGQNLDVSFLDGFTEAIDAVAAEVAFDSYDVEVRSTNGTTFRVGHSTSTLLKAFVFKNGVDVTDVTPAGWFQWQRVSGIPQAAPNDDATWNNLYLAGYKQVSVNVDDVYARATFFCNIISP
jgi:hypothetical protein